MFAAPSVCFSDEYKKENRTQMYDFYETVACPKEDQRDNMNMCCGYKTDNEEYCCTSGDK